MTKNKGTNKIFAAVAVLLIAAAYFTANVPLTPEMAAISAANVLLFAAPAFWASFRWLGWRNSIFLWIILGVYALTIETTALLTAFPYGGFRYGELIGGKLFGLTPWTVPFAWTPLALGACAAARNLSSKKVVGAVLFIAFLIAADLVIDPGAVRLGFWKYAVDGAFYGVPLSNFIGWVVSSALAFIIIEYFLIAVRPLMSAPVQLLYSAAAVIVFWTAINAFSGMLIPAAVGVLLLIAFAAVLKKNYNAFDNYVVLTDENNSAIGTALKSEIHTAETPLHRAFSIFLFNDKGEVLLQQRAFSKKTWGGVWSNSCCGHVMLHENVVNAAKRRLKFELGISARDLKIVLPNFRYRAEKDGVVENEFCPVLIGRFDGECRINTDEVEKVEWMKWNEFIAKIEGESKFSPWSVLEAKALKKIALDDPKGIELTITQPENR